MEHGYPEEALQPGMRKRGEEEEVTKERPAPAIKRQADFKDLPGTVRRAWEFDYRNQLYYLAEAEEEPSMLVKKGPVVGGSAKGAARAGYGGLSGRVEKRQQVRRTRNGALGRRR